MGTSEKEKFSDDIKFVKNLFKKIENLELKK